MEEMEERKLLVSRVQTPDGNILTSYHRHDFVTYTDANGEEYMLDGGNDYQRTYVNKEPAKDVSIYEDDPFEKIRKVYSPIMVDKQMTPLELMDDESLNYFITMFSEKDNSKFHKNTLKYLMKELEYRNEIC